MNKSNNMNKSNMGKIIAIGAIILAFIGGIIALIIWVSTSTPTTTSISNKPTPSDKGGGPGGGHPSGSPNGSPNGKSWTCDPDKGGPGGRLWGGSNIHTMKQYGTNYGLGWDKSTDMCWARTNKNNPKIGHGLCVSNCSPGLYENNTHQECQYCENPVYA